MFYWELPVVTINWNVPWVPWVQPYVILRMDDYTHLAQRCLPYMCWFSYMFTCMIIFEHIAQSRHGAFSLRRQTNHNYNNYDNNLKKYPHNLLNDFKIWASRNNTHKHNNFSWDSKILIHIIHITTENSVTRFINFLQTHIKLNYRQNVRWLHGLSYLGWYRIYSASSEICTQFAIFLLF